MISAIFPLHIWSPVWVTWFNRPVVRHLKHKECLCTRIHSRLATSTRVVYCGIEWSILKRNEAIRKTQPDSLERSSGGLSCSGPCSHSPCQSQAFWKRGTFLNICSILTMLFVPSKQIIWITNGIVSKYNIPQCLQRCHLLCMVESWSL